MYAERKEINMNKKMSEIKGFENCGNYTIFDDGRIYSERKKSFLQPLYDTKGYQYIDIRYRKALLKCPKIHQLVMLAFSNQDPKEQINHIDGNKTNNHISNLEWVTNRENREHAIENGLKDEIGYGIAQYDLDGNLLNIFETANEACKYLNKPENPGNIGRAIKGNRKTCYGFIWKQYEGSTTIER